jgi:glycosyltransferase involved in cell wall biosynthesis
MDQNLISIHILAYNAEKTLSQTLQSVKVQQGVVFEIVFVNDASSDSTLSIIEQFKKENPYIPCTIISNQTNLGITKSRNLALQNSKGNYITVLDSDDIWIEPMKLSEQLSFLLKNKEIIAVGTQMNIVDNTGEIIKQTKYETTDSNIRNKFLISNQIAHSSVLFKRTNLRYDESLYIWEDYDFFLKLGEQGELANLNQVMVNYLYNPQKYSFSRKIKLISTEIKIIKRYKKQYPNFWFGYSKRILKYILTLLHLK